MSIVESTEEPTLKLGQEDVMRIGALLHHARTVGAFSSLGEIAAFNATMATFSEFLMVECGITTEEGGAG